MVGASRQPRTQLMVGCSNVVVRAAPLFDLTLSTSISNSYMPKAPLLAYGAIGRAAIEED